MTRFDRNLEGGMTPSPPGYAYGYKKKVIKENSSRLTWCSIFHWQK